MQLEYYGDEVIVTLSRRNILSLLSKLENGKQSTIHKVILPKEGEEPHSIKILTVIGEANDAHYGDKEAGEMDDADEAFIAEHEEEPTQRYDAIARVMGMPWLTPTPVT